MLGIIVAEVLVIFIDGNTRIKGIQIADHEIRIVNFADDTIIFLRNFSCLTKTWLILELSEKASSSKMSFSKKQPLWGVGYKIRIDKTREMTWSQFSIKMVGVSFHGSAYDNRNWDKIFDNLTKNNQIWNTMQLSFRGKK